MTDERQAGTWTAEDGRRNVERETGRPIHDSPPDERQVGLRAEDIDREIEAIKACPHCGGESERDRGRIEALHWVRAALALAQVPAPDGPKFRGEPGSVRGPIHRGNPLGAAALPDDGREGLRAHEHAEWCASWFELLPEDPAGGPTGVMGPCDCEFDRLTKLLEAAEQAGYERGRRLAALPDDGREGLHVERAAIEAGTHEPAVDDFGNQYLSPVATPADTARLRSPSPTNPGRVSRRGASRSRSADEGSPPSPPASEPPQ